MWKDEENFGDEDEKLLFVEMLGKYHFRGQISIATNKLKRNPILREKR